MNQELTVKATPVQTRPSTNAHVPLVNVLETSATKGEWIVPAAKEVSVALALSNFSASWRGSRGPRSENVSAGTMAICEFNQSRHFEMRSAANFSLILMRSEVLQQVVSDSRHIRTQLQPHDILQDATLRRLMEVLLREKREGFQSGVFFLDSIVTALASYLVRHYSVAPSLETSSAGGMAPSTLRRCIEYMQAHLEGDLRLSELARQAGLSASHFIRSFRRSTGTTPHEFLLHQRVERAKILMRDHSTSLTEVALASGFADQHHLARVFRRITSVTPSSYRRSL
jgi:AraC family transcriptional regulator